MKIQFFLRYAKDVVLEAEVNPGHAKKFEADYLAITGSSPVVGTGYQRQVNKWGTECRIYFNGGPRVLNGLAKLGIKVEQGRRPYRTNRLFRINNCNFFWELIKSGRRLG